MVGSPRPLPYPRDGGARRPSRELAGGRAGDSHFPSATARRGAGAGPSPAGAGGRALGTRPRGEPSLPEGGSVRAAAGAERSRHPSGPRPGTPPAGPGPQPRALGEPGVGAAPAAWQPQVRRRGAGPR